MHAGLDYKTNPNHAVLYRTQGMMINQLCQ